MCIWYYHSPDRDNEANLLQMRGDHELQLHPENPRSSRKEVCECSFHFRLNGRWFTVRSSSGIPEGERDEAEGRGQRCLTCFGNEIGSDGEKRRARTKPLLSITLPLFQDNTSRTGVYGQLACCMIHKSQIRPLDMGSRENRPRLSKLPLAMCAAVHGVLSQLRLLKGPFSPSCWCYCYIINIFCVSGCYCYIINRVGLTQERFEKRPRTLR